jgi:TonB-dependent receptor
MYKCVCLSVLSAILLSVFCPTSSFAQGRPGSITGTATSTDQSALPGAQVELYPGNFTSTTNLQGQFVITNIAPGTYTLTITYVGFTQFTKAVEVKEGQSTKVDAVLGVSQKNEVVEVTAGRAYGEAEAVNQTLSSDTLVNILPSNVMISLPNANVADAVGRLPGVTLERDEGEGKYVQIRGTEPRMSNLLIDGFLVPSPEGGVRQVKLDTIPIGQIESIEVNKTFQANMEGNAIGGSVSLVTKSAGERPTVSLYGAGGFTPIIHTVGVAEVGGTVGKRLGAQKQWGLLFSGSYDYNGRGINDLEPEQTLLPGTTFTPGYFGASLRTYKYDRSRYGFGASADYKLSETSLIYAKFLFSDFQDYGYRYEYVIQTVDSVNNGNTPTITTERRDGNYQVGNFILGGNHVFTKSWLNWGLSVGHARMLNPLNGGESITDFVPVAGFATNCQYDPNATKNIYKPQFTQACFDEIYNPQNWQLNVISQSNHGKSDQLNLAAAVSAARNYHLGGHASTFEMGFKFRNEHKFDNSYTNDYQHNANLPTPTAAPVLVNTFWNGFTNPSYYGGAYKFAPNSPNWAMGNAYLTAHPGDFTLTSTYGGNPQNFDLVEQVTAGYVMNTTDFGKFRFIAGLRIEGTNDKTVSFNQVTSTLDLVGGGNYISWLPSASLRYRLDNQSDIRVAFSRSLNRPDPQYLTASFSTDCGTLPCTITEGNSTLRPEYSLNYDLLYERSLTPFGLLQAGVFYKQLSDPVVATQVTGNATTCPPSVPSYPNCLINTPVNAGSGHIGGFEIAFLHHLTYLPGLLKGLGISANYSYSWSQATNVSPGRTDSPALLRQAPNTWNISPTYDRGRLSVRLGLAYNGPNIYVYNFSGDPTTPGGLHGPSGDQYLYSHFQVDLQGSYRIHNGLYFTAAGLNLNNEVFGFYYGSPQFVNQREFYRPTYTFGFRWDPFAAR